MSMEIMKSLKNSLQHHRFMNSINQNAKDYDGMTPLNISNTIFDLNASNGKGITAFTFKLEVCLHKWTISCEYT